MIDLGLIAERLQAARLNQGLTLDDASEKTGFSARTLRRFESQGVQELTKLDTLATAYNVDLIDLLYERNTHFILAETIQKLGKNACRILVSLCKAMEY
ncbi:MAG: helix-turn-helix domain-containing protein [Candidatus Thiodiazotropha lotti]|nr:helix-turn-helix domain-containing protein [Candidatus Thiodiazotropha lotti]MCW4188298.1 helix-turn-helix domain-containing protein [Candidatus Thiodiazotropha lotti]